MKKLFQLLKQSLLDQENTVLVTVLASSGSTPRGTGARMIVNRSGRLYGTIGGGAVEYQALQRAAEILSSKKSYVKGFKLAPQQVEDLGMICGGEVVVFFQFLDAADHRLLALVEAILSLFDRDEDAWLITDISDETAWDMGIYSKSRGAVGLSLDSARLKSLLASSAVQVNLGSKRYYVEPLVRAGRVIIFGGGHVAQELVPVLTRVGFRCLVMDDREEFANKRLFPAAHEIVVGDFYKISDYIYITENDYVVVMTRGHHHDFIVLEQVLRIKTAYVGVIGSRRKVAATNARLRGAGVSQEAIDRIYTPIGIPIKAETPAEIAISIAGELILVRAERLGSAG